jgi:hypothetical protein
VTAPLFDSSIKSLPLLSRGKVRDIYAVNDEQLLIVTSDRLSAFDVILPNPIPDKGKVLTQVANFWFDKLAHIVPGQLTGVDPESVVAPDERDQVRGRAVVVKRLRPLPIEAVVRGYLIGSGWKDYQTTGAVCGIKLAEGLKMAQKLPQPIFTPATKADIGEHDENISFEASQAHCAKVLAEALYGTARHHHCRHQVRVRHRQGRHAAPDRRSADAGFLALLAGRPVRGRQEPAVLRQAVRARLSGDAGLEQDGAGPEPAGRHRRAHRCQVPRSLREAYRPQAGLNLDRRALSTFCYHRQWRQGDFDGTTC